MPLQKIVPKPGVNVQFTKTLAEGTWSASQYIRFKDGLPQKRGGWQKFIQEQVIGSARGCHSWADLSSNKYFAIGTNERLQVVFNGNLYDITPIAATVNIAVDFDTTNLSTTVRITDSAHGAAAGDWINVVIPVSVGGIIIHGYYQIIEVISSSEYNITSATAATATVVAGGAVPVFDTTNTLATVDVTLADHGLDTGDPFEVEVSTSVGGLTLSGTYYVTSVTDADTFVITDDQTASSDATLSENAGNARIEYLLASGNATAEPLAGWGVGPWGGGPWGMSGGVTSGYSVIRQWALDNWGENLVGNPTNGALYEWVPPDTSIPAQVIATAPTMMTQSLVAMPARIMVSFGSETGGNQDFNLVRWSAVDDNTDWTPTATNQAGSYRIPTGSKIVGAKVVGQQILIWTDVDVWTMQYVGLPFVFSFNKLAPTSEMISMRACAFVGNYVYWASPNGIFRFGGGNVDKVPCSVWDLFFNNYNTVQVDKIHMGSTDLFNEVELFFPTTGSDEVNFSIKFNPLEGAWDYNQNFVRLCWEDGGVFDYPLTVDGNNYIQQHESGYDADGLVMNESVQSAYIDIGDGDFYVFVERCIPDFKWTGTTPTIQLYLYTINYPGQENTPATYGPYTIGTTTDYIIIRARGRQAALKLEGNTIGSAWRYGAVRFYTQPAGMR